MGVEDVLSKDRAVCWSPLLTDREISCKFCENAGMPSDVSMKLADVEWPYGEWGLGNHYVTTRQH
jgi:hypothetical protein